MCLMEKNWLAGVFDQYDEMVLNGFAMQAVFLLPRRGNNHVSPRRLCLAPGRDCSAVRAD